MKTAILICQFLTMLPVVAVPFARAFRFAQIGPAIKRGWLLIALWYVFWALVAPVAAYRSGWDVASVEQIYPDGPTVGPMLLFGWLFSGFVVWVALSIRLILRKYFPSSRWVSRWTNR